jgi:hypothetical protein
MPPSLHRSDLNLSNQQIGEEPGPYTSEAQAMTEYLRHGLVSRTPAAKLQGEVEPDEVAIVVGHKGQPAEVEERDARDGGAGLPARRDAARRKRTSHRSSA